MSSKIIYFVRHGQTENNAHNIRQGPDGPLTPAGREQALITANKFPKQKGCPQVIIASPYERTRETAQIIQSVLHLPVEYSDLLVERKNPSEIVGRSGDEPEVRLIVDKIDKSFHDDKLRYSDEENFTDLRVRAEKLLKYIKHRSEKRIIMVTHGIFLKMVIAEMIHHRRLTASEYNTLSFFNPMDNAGLTICKYTRTWLGLGRGKWELLMYNDITEIIEKPEIQDF